MCGNSKITVFKEMAKEIEFYESLSKGKAITAFTGKQGMGTHSSLGVLRYCTYKAKQRFLRLFVRN